MSEASDIVGLILDYRNRVRTRACIASMVDAGIKRIVVVDNSAYPDSEVSSRRYQEAFPEAFVMELIQNRNLGFSAGVNEGLREIQNRWPNSNVLLLNNDAVIDKDLPFMLYSALQSDRTAAVAYPAMIQNGKRYHGAWYQPLLGLISARPMPRSIHYASGCCQLIAMSRIPREFFDESFFMYGEDIALAWTLHRSGFKQILVKSCVVRHEGSASSGNGSLFYETLLVESHFRLAHILSGGNPILFVLYFSARCAVLPVRALIRSLRLMSFAPLKGLVDGFWRALNEPQGPPGEAVNENNCR